MHSRRSIGKMPYKQRINGLCALERRDELKLWLTIVNILTLIVDAGLGALQLVFLLPSHRSAFTWNQTRNLLKRT